MVSQPLVTVICLSFNHVKYLEEAVLSVVNQTYPHIQLILTDNGSTDGSSELLRDLHAQFPYTELLQLPENIGNCSAFNRALQLAKGKYIIDLSADDLLFTNRITEQVQFFESQPDITGLIFSDCEMVNKNGVFLHTHYKRNRQGLLVKNVASGFVFQDILRAYFICTPTMMMRKGMLDTLHGYDESLSYEDFDLWVRASKKWRFVFQDKVLTKKRVLKKSLGTGFYSQGENIHLRSTLIVCKKAFALCESKEDFDALAVCVSYHLRQSLFCEDFELVKQYYSLQEQIGKLSFPDKMSNFLALIHFSLFDLYSLYRKIK